MDKAILIASIFFVASALVALVIPLLTLYPVRNPNMWKIEVACTAVFFVLALILSTMIDIRSR